MNEKKAESCPCLYQKDELKGDGDCGYGVEFSCEECICNGGKLDPRKELSE